ncbi:hypothetical protein H5410_057775 [Solanum commersonii]|uniref:Uncharacterized protein n=1 Tax=Solanum commersonii TaxID=4109 RepID=A0A9J5WP29_SOLCO|nr:hypothetical protein H5410_057775 [Solanum commersonii]
MFEEKEVLSVIMSCAPDKSPGQMASSWLFSKSHEVISIKEAKFKSADVSNGTSEKPEKEAGSLATAVSFNRNWLALIDTGSTWTSNLRRNVHDWELPDLLDLMCRLGNFIPEEEAVDRLLWGDSREGLYTVKAGYSQ